MSGFDPQAVGNLLREEREKRGITLAQAAMALHVRQKYLTAIEAGQFSAIAQEIYVAGCVKSYARWLGIVLDERVISIPKMARNVRILKSVGEDSEVPWWFGIAWIYGWIRLPRQRLMFASAVGTLLLYSFWYAAFYQAPFEAPDPTVLMFFP
jgi:transcriptional regulator with XRE-family HTH domain